jgi:hypothetical protein
MDNNESARISLKIVIIVVFLTLLVFSNIFLSSQESEMLSHDKESADDQFHSQKLKIFEEEYYNSQETSKYELQFKNYEEVFINPSIKYIFKDDPFNTDFISKKNIIYRKFDTIF